MSRFETRFGLLEHFYYINIHGDGGIEREGTVRQIEIFAGDMIVGGVAVFYIPEEYPEDRILSEFCFATPHEREMWRKEQGQNDGYVRQSPFARGENK